jgi:hypothetical protein
VQPVLVVVGGVDTQDSVEVSASEDEDAIEAVTAEVRTQRSANAFALGARTGVQVNPDPVGAKDPWGAETRPALSARSAGVAVASAFPSSEAAFACVDALLRRLSVVCVAGAARPGRSFEGA